MGWGLYNNAGSFESGEGHRKNSEDDGFLITI